MKSLLAAIIGYCMGAGGFSTNPWVGVVTGSMGLICLWLWRKVDKSMRKPRYDEGAHALDLIRHLRIKANSKGYSAIESAIDAAPDINCCEGGPQWGHAWGCPKCPD